MAPPFFIVGNDRSGTTMLRLILDRGEEAAIPTESMILGDFAPVRRGAHDLSQHEQAVDFARTVWCHPKVQLWGLEGNPPIPPTGLTHDAAYRFCVEAPYLAYAARDGKERWGDKTPSYVHHIDELLAVWPDARIVVLERDGRDVAMSIIPLPFGGNNVWAAARDWADGIRAGREAEQAHPDNVRIVRYEDLVADPEPHVRALCEFVELGFDLEMLDVERTNPDKIVADQAEWFTNLWSGINQKSVGKWRTRMSAADQRAFVQVAGAELAMCGYEVPVDPDEVTALRVAGYWAHNKGRRAYNFARLRLVQERGRELRYVLRRKLRRL